MLKNAQSEVVQAINNSHLWNVKPPTAVLLCRNCQACEPAGSVGTTAYNDAAAETQVYM